MNTIIKKQDSTFGGYEYIEYNTAAKRFHTGNSRAHTGHYGGDTITITVSSVKELNSVKDQIMGLGFKRVEREDLK